jgi:hypothetical protein
MIRWWQPFGIVLVAANCGLEPPPPVDPVEQNVRWCLEDDPHAQVKDMRGFYRDLGGLVNWARQGASDDLVKPRRRLEERKEFQLVTGQCRWLSGNEYVLTLNVLDIRDGRVLFEPLSSQPIPERLAMEELARAGHGGMRNAQRGEPAFLVVFDFSGRDRGNVPLERLPASLRQKGIPIGRLPASVFAPELLAALRGEKPTFRLHVRVIRVNYVAEKQEGDFTALLYSVRLRAVLP